VKLQVVDRQEQVSTIERTITVLNVPPTVNVGADQTVLWGQSLATSSFSVSDLSNADEAALVCTWNFGDGTTRQLTPCTTSAVRIAHAYANPGTYTATLTATDPDGGTKSDSLLVTVKKRDTLVQALNVRNIAGGQVEITAKLFERYGWTVVPNESVIFTAGTATTSAKTGTGGTATVTLPRAAGLEKVGVSMGATTHYNPSAMERVIDAPLGDIIFIVDESGSMGDDQNDISRHLTSMTEQLASKVDFRLGVVGFGAAGGTHGTKRNGEGHIEQTLTNEIGPVARAIDSLEVNGNFEAGFDATKVAMSDAMSFRPNAGTCAIMVTDDFADLSS
jgi:PKD repeat protein